MIDVVATMDLNKVINTCKVHFRSVLTHINFENPPATDFGILRNAWTDYYFGSFHEFDVLLKSMVDDIDSNYSIFLPISISHHNLHRLMEVIDSEIGDQLLGSTRIPERIQDLLEVCSRLYNLIDEIRDYSVKNET